MSTVNQLLTTPIATTDLTISLWVKAPIADFQAGDPIIQFGDPNDPSYVILENSPGIASIKLVGPRFFDSLSETNGNPQSLGFDASGFLLDEWNHIFISVQLHGGLFGSSFGFGPPDDVYNDAYCFVNGVSTLNYGGAPFGKVAQIAASGSGTNGSPVSGVIVGGAVILPRGSGPSAIGVPFIEDSFIVPANSVFFLAAVQIWFSLYIEPTPTNLSKFISTDGQLIEPSVAQEYFGRGQIVFDGDKDHFPINQVGGDTTLAGDLEDVPYPVGLDIA